MIEMDCFQFLEILRDVVVSGAAIITASVACIGLSSWKRQLAGKAEFEASLGLAKAAYKLRDEIQGCRSPIVSGSEFPEGYSSIRAEPQQVTEAWMYVYSNRWRLLQGALREFDAACLEAEALWGEGIRDKSTVLVRCIGKLYGAIDAFINDKKSEGENFRHDREFGKGVMSLLHSSGLDAQDPLTQDIIAAVQGIDDFVRPHLSRK